MTDSTTDLVSFLQELKQLIAKEEDYCLPNAKQNDECRNLLKKLFDAVTESSLRKFGPLDSLIVEGFDEETIWEELQTRNKPFLKYFQKKYTQWKKKIDETQNKKHQELADLTGTDQESNSEADGESENEEFDEEQEATGAFDDEEDAEMEEEEDEERDLEDDESDEDIDEESDEEQYEEEEEEPQNNKKPKKKSSIYEEELKMEAWLDAFEEMENKHRDREERLEKKAQRQNSGGAKYGEQWSDEEEGDDDDEDDDLAFVQNAMYNSEGDEDEEDDEDDDLDPSKIKYKDFFVDGNEEEEDNRRGVQTNKYQKSSKKISFAKDEDNFDDDDEDDQEDGDDFDEEHDDYDDEDDDNDEDDQDNNNNNTKTPSKFMTNYQRRQYELQQQIKDLEQELIGEKSWELLGEVKAENRPENSILDVSLDLERSTKVAPIITQEFTSSLEEMIIKRIKDQKFDDPNPHQRRAIAEAKITDPGMEETPSLSQEKSKQGLGDIYAEEYARKFLNTEETNNLKTKELQEEVINLFNHLSRQLNELSHFYFTPKPIVDESSAKVLATQRALPAVEMEDVTPFHTTSQADKAAPQEILEKKRGKKITLLSSEEMTSSDRKKLRKFYKEKNKEEKAKKTAEDKLLHPNKAPTDDQITKELRADKRVTLTTDKSGKNGKDASAGSGSSGGGPSYSNSSSFFNYLQKETEQSISHKRKNDGSSDYASKKQKKSADTTSTSANFKL